MSNTCKSVYCGFSVYAFFPLIIIILYYSNRPERQQAVALWWKSKPAFKEFGRQASPLPLKSLDKGKLHSWVVLLFCLTFPPVWRKILVQLRYLVDSSLRIAGVIVMYPPEFLLGWGNGTPHSSPVRCKCCWYVGYFQWVR